MLTGEALARHHPGQNREAFRRYRTLGEAEFVRRSGRRFVRELEPARFLRTTARRVWHFFFWHRRQPWDGGGASWRSGSPAPCRGWSCWPTR